MSSLTFRLPVGTDVFNDLPKSAKSFLKEGLNVLSRVYAQQPPIILSLVMEGAAGSEPKAGDLSTKFGLGEDDSQSLVGAISFLVLILSHPRPEPIPTIVKGLLSAEILAPDAEAAVALLLNDVSRTAAANATFRRSSLATRLLPAFSNLSSAIDIRLDFEKDQVVIAVPVALIHIDTDASEEQLRFQMTKRQIEGMVEDLKRVLTRLDAAEKWMQGRPL
jgi:hypothetical protein